MAIRRPGEKFRHNKILSKRKGKRSVAALLSLTAMVDMFTVLVIFLLQNFSGDQQYLIVHKDIKLPKAESTKDLKPAFVVTISKTEVILDKTVIATVDEVKNQGEEWMITKLKDQLTEALQKAKIENTAKFQKQIQDVVNSTKGQIDSEQNSWNKITIEADKDVDFLTVKKVMYTVTESGAGEINFAVTKTPKNQPN